MSIQLDQWFCTPAAEYDPYTPPEKMLSLLAGIATGHPKNPLPHPVTCSPAVGKRGNLIVTKSGSEYELLEVETGYEAAFPGARERVFASLPELP